MSSDQRGLRKRKRNLSHAYQNKLYVYFLITTLVLACGVWFPSGIGMTNSTEEYHTSSSHQGYNLVPGLRQWRDASKNIHLQREGDSKDDAIIDQDVLDRINRGILNDPPQVNIDENDNEDENLSHNPIRSGVHSQSHDLSTTTKKEYQKRKPRAMIAYAIVILSDKCSSVSHIAAAAVLAENIHQMSFRRHPTSNFTPKLFAFVFEGRNNSRKSNCNAQLQAMGYTVLSAELPHLHVLDEAYIKLYAFSLTIHDIVVVIEPNTLLLQPLDALFYQLLGDGMKSSENSLEDNDLDWNSKQTIFISTKTKENLIDPSFFIIRTSREVYDSLLQKVQQKPQQTFQHLLEDQYGTNLLELDRCVFNTQPLLKEKLYTASVKDGSEDDNSQNDNENECSHIKFEQIQLVSISSSSYCDFAPWECRQSDFLFPVKSLDTCQKLHQEWHRNRRMMDERHHQNENLPDPNSGLEHSFGYCRTVGDFIPVQYPTLHPEEVG
jgi:hypothetical protein